MVDACEKTGVYFIEGFMYRFHPQFHAALRRMLEQAPVGELRTIHVQFFLSRMNPQHSRIRLQRALGGGALADVGVYRN